MTKPVRYSWMLEHFRDIDHHAGMSFAFRNPELLATLLSLVEENGVGPIAFSILEEKTGYSYEALRLVCRAFGAMQLVYPTEFFNVCCRVRDEMRETLEESRKMEANLGGFGDLEPVA